MTYRVFSPFAAAFLFACSGPPAVEETSAPQAEAPEAPVPPVPGWEKVAGAGGTVLRLTDGRQSLLAITCGPARLSVTAPSFRPVMSEDRFVLGLGDEPVTLVANPYEQEKGEGVTGEGPVPAGLGAWMEKASEVSALYGAQQAGPYPAPPPPLKASLAESCGL